MIKKIMSAMGLVAAASSASATDVNYSPYKDDSVNFMYNLLFCDNESLFKPKDNKHISYWEEAFFIEPNEKKIREIAENPNEESRIRALAFNWLMREGKAITKKNLLGVIVEVPLSGGLDALAAYSDGRVRYINHTGKLVVVELGVRPDIEALAKNLINASHDIIKKIGPWDKERLPPPEQGNVRLTFLVSDGLYFGEGPMNVIQADAMAGPVFSAAIELLQLVVKVSTEKN